MRAASFLAVLALLSFALPLAKANSTEIPFTYADGFIIVKAKIPQSPEPLNFLVDSGAGLSVLGLNTAHRLQLHLGSSQRVQGVDMQAEAFKLSGVMATGLDGTALDKVPLAVDLSNAGQLCREPVDGLLGVDFFRSRVVQIDFPAQRIRLLSSAPVGGTTLPIKPFNGTLCVPISVNGSRNRWARLDTGCNDALHWVVPKTRERRSAAQVSIGFMTDDSNLALSDLTLGGENLNKIPTSLHATPLFPGEAGLVGNGIWSRYVVTFDVPHNRLLLQR